MTEGVTESEGGDGPSSVEGSPEEDEERRRRRHQRQEEHRRKVRRRRRRKRALIATAVTLATLLVLGVVWFWWTFGGLQRLPDSVGQAGVEAPGTTILPAAPHRSTKASRIRMTVARTATASANAP